jgi:hypothetical protein
MFKKELRDTLRVLLESSLLLLSIPIVMGISLLIGSPVPFYQLAYGAFVITLFGFAVYSGLSFFQAERKDNGFEYLFTLPLSKLKIFLYKILPRILVLMALAALVSIFFSIGIKNLIFAVIIIQLGATFLSMAFSSLLPGFIGFLVLSGLYGFITMFITNVYYHIKEISFSYSLEQVFFDPFTVFSPYHLAAFGVLIPLGISFFLALGKLDLRPHKYIIRPYLFVALPVLLIETGVIFLLYDKFVYV